jgi:predicted component of type VI protein secretion system
LTSVVCLKHGDRIEIGPLSFTVLMESVGQPKHPDRPADDEIAAWLVGAEGKVPEFEGFELNDHDTAESATLPGPPQRQPNPSQSDPAKDATRAAYEFLRSLSVTKPDTN